MAPDTAAMEALKAKAPEAAELLRLLSNPNRLMILCQLAETERSVAQLEQILGIRQPGLSQQLAELRQSGLVATRRESRSIYYSIADDRARAIMGLLYEVFCRDARAVADRLRPEPEHPAVGDSAWFARVAVRDRS